MWSFLRIFVSKRSGIVENNTWPNLCNTYTSCFEKLRLQYLRQACHQHVTDHLIPFFLQWSLPQLLSLLHFLLSVKQRLAKNLKTNNIRFKRSICLLFFNYYAQNKLPIFNIAPVLIYCLHHLHRKSFHCRELSPKKSLYPILIINHLYSSFVSHVFWIKMEKSYKGAGISKELSTFLSWRKEHVIGYKTKAVHEKEVIVEIWCSAVCKTQK